MTHPGDCRAIRATKLHWPRLRSAYGVVAASGVSGVQNV